MGGLWLYVVMKIWATRQVERGELDRKDLVKVSNGNTLRRGKSRMGKRNSKKGRSGGLHAKTQGTMPSKIHKRKEDKAKGTPVKG